MPGQRFAFGPFVLNLDNGTLLRDGDLIAVGRRGALLLGTLLKARGEVVTKTELMDVAWPGTAIEESNLPVQIASLRKLLGRAPDGGEWITTVQRVGYRFVGEAEAPVAGHTPVLPAEPVALAGGILMENGAPAVAVLPFENLSPDPEQSFLADGVVEEIITALSRFRTFAVVARNSTFAYKGRAMDVRDIARDLGVRYVLQGSVRRSGDRVRVNAQLIAGASGAHLWAEKFEGAVADIFDFQDEITRSVIGVVEPQIRKAEIERARRKRPESLVAWDLYVQALPLVYSANVPGYTEAIALLDRAIALDPGYAPALALAAWAHEKRHTFGGAAPPGVDDVEVCLALAERAMEADPDDAMAMALLGWLRIMFRADHAGLSLCVRAVEINPNNIAVLDLAAIAQLFVGDLDEVIAYSMRGLRLSPGASDAYQCLNHIALAHFDAERFEEAAGWAQRSIDLEKNYVYSRLCLAASRAQLGRIEGARAEMRVALALRPDFTIKTANSVSVRFPDRLMRLHEGLRKAGMPEG